MNPVSAEHLGLTQPRLFKCIVPSRLETETHLDILQYGLYEINTGPHPKSDQLFWFNEILRT